MLFYGIVVALLRDGSVGNDAQVELPSPRSRSEMQANDKMLQSGDGHGLFARVKRRDIGFGESLAVPSVNDTFVSDMRPLDSWQFSGSFFYNYSSNYSSYEAFS